MIFYLQIIFAMAIILNDCITIADITNFQSYLTNSHTKSSSVKKSLDDLLLNRNDFNIMSRSLIDFRGGEAIRKKKKSILKTVKESLDQVYPATRLYLLLSLFCTIVHVIGLPAPALFALDKSRLWEIWRPFTSLAYLGAPSMSMANSLYFLIRYGQTLESSNGTGEHTWFLMIQTVILSILSLLIGFPFQGQSMIAAAVYVSSHMNPMEKIPFQFGFVITSWQLPFCMMFIDILSQQSIEAAWPHLLGIFSGHFYHFFTKIWPQMGGKFTLQPPKWILRKFGEKRSNIGIDFSNKIDKKDKKHRIKKNSGRKLG